jgi:hypothetical protein
MSSPTITPNLVPLANPVPFNLWATTTNRLFYSNTDDPLRAFRTLGSADPLLPLAFALSLTNSEAPRPSIHEIGSGNFFFAKEVIRQAPSLASYTAYDFSDVSFKTHGASLPEMLSFTKRGALQAREEITSPHSHVVGVELCDDLPNEFWSCHQGHPVEMWMEMGIDPSLRLPHRAAHQPWRVNVDPTAQGDLTLPALDANILSDLISTGQWKELDNYNPGLLKAIHYQTRQFFPTSLSSIFDKGWRSMPEEFRSVGEKILERYAEDLKLIEEFGNVLHLPTAAIAMLWQMRDLPAPSALHFFDYGYEFPNSTPAAFMTFQGQVSTPVNFGMLKYAAEQMGYKVTLEKDREFIQRITGEDTLIIARIRGLDLHILGPEAEDVLLMEFFGEAAQDLSPTAEVSPSTIRGLRVRRDVVDDVASRLNRTYTYQDGSYYLRAEV